MPCAIKMTKPDATFHDRMEFLNEAKVMKKYKSHHVIELYGKRLSLHDRIPVRLCIAVSGRFMKVK